MSVTSCVPPPGWGQNFHFLLKHPHHTPGSGSWLVDDSHKGNQQFRQRLLGAALIVVKVGERLLPFQLCCQGKFQHLS
jgi:hypothetical protein